ncbi:hypothetical protein FBU31_002009 [Coemansia sp. 'formosensis']|nr:hypothetical protein FBU31_002009 [Coemansia sp. 'formosensis']
MLESEPYNNRVFPNVRSTSFTISMPSAFDEPANNAITLLGADLDIRFFVCQIKEMAPAMSKIRISLLPDVLRQRPLPIKKLDNLIWRLSKSVVDIDYEFYHQPVIVDQDLCGLRSLVYASIYLADDGEQIMQLTQRNALTLQSLDIDVDGIMDVTNLIQNADGGYIQYPCLQALKLNGAQDWDEAWCPVFPGAVPFPSLRRLFIGSENPFGDDTVFRGNAAVLESLSLLPSPFTVRILRKYKVFTLSSHPKLRQVSFGVHLNSEPDLFETDIDAMRFLPSIGPNASVRTVFDSPWLQSAIPVFGEFTCTQVLTLGSVHLNLWDAIALIKALPLLSDICAKLPVLAMNTTSMVV